MASAFFLAFDFGAGSGRAVLGRLGDTLKLEVLHRFPNYQIQLLDYYHWDLLGLYHELKQGLAEAAKAGFRDLEGVGVDTWGVDYGLVGERDVVLENPVCYRDARTQGMMEKFFRRISRKQIYELTGVQFMELNTLFQVYSMVESRHPLLPCIKKLLFMPDLFHYFLTGCQTTEYTIASTSQLLNCRSRTWEKRILDALEISESIMPEIVEPGTLLGELREPVKQETGLRSAPVIAPASHDTASAVAAVPALSGKWAYLSSGTWSLMGIETFSPIVSDKSLEYNFTNEGGVNRTIRFLRNLMGLWLLEGCKKSWHRAGEDLEYPVLFGMAEKAVPFRSLIDPDDPIFLNPPDMQEAIITCCRKRNQPVPDSRGAFVRCILESLALKYLHIFKRIQEMDPGPIEVLHIVGGGSQNRMLNQFTANVLNIPVIAGPVEATAIGNILTQALAKKRLGSIAEGRELVRRSFSCEEFEPKSHEEWQEAYQKASTLFQF